MYKLHKQDNSMISCYHFVQKQTRTIEDPLYCDDMSKLDIGLLNNAAQKISNL
jgi:hypothetical protein